MTELLSHENDVAKYRAEVDWETFEKAVEEVYQANKQSFQIPGFRKGKAPRKIIEANYGEGIFYEDALNRILPDLIEKAVEDLDVEPIGQPDVDVTSLEKGQPVVFEISTETKPHPELGDYTKIEVLNQDVNIAEEDIDKVVQEEADKNAVMIQVDDRPAQEGDEVTIDYSGEANGEVFEGGTAEDQKLVLGSNSFIPGFEDQVVGHEIGEEFDINVQFPEDYGAEDLAGQEAIFHIRLKAIAVKELPEIDDEFAQDVSEYDSLEEYRNSIREDLEERDAKMNRANQENEAIQSLIEISDVNVPESMIEQQVENEVRDMAQQVQQFGLSLDQYLQYTGSSMEKIREEARPLAKTRVAGDLVLASLVEEQGIEVSEEELDEELLRLGEAYGAQDAEDFKNRVKEMGTESLVEEDLKKRKAIDYLMEQVQYVDRKESTEEEKPDESEEQAESAEENSEE